MQQGEAYKKENKGRGELTKHQYGPGATGPPIEWRVGPTLGLIREVDVVLQVALMEIKVSHPNFLTRARQPPGLLR